jgi:hypothetical protein
MKKTFAVSIVAVLLTGMASIASASKPTATSLTKKLDECISRQKNISAVFLIDESSSLSLNDPKNERIPALKAAARALNSLTRGKKANAVEVRVAIAGFEGSFNIRQGWTELSDATLDEVLTVLDKEEKRKTVKLTRYHVALKGSLDLFAKDNDEGEACRILVWFSDGEHDNDNVSGLSSVEKNQISKEICGAGGYADGLRKAGAFIQAVGLNKDAAKFALMQLVSEDSGSFASGGLSLAKCGVEPASGRFGNASDSSQIVDIITNLPGGAQDDVVTNKCDDIESCSEINFTVDQSITSFKIQVTRPSVGIDSVVLSRGDEEWPLFDTPEEGRVDFLDIEPLTADKVLVDAQSSSAQPLVGNWTIRFLGKNALQATGRVKFVGEADIQVLDEAGKAVTDVDRFEAVPLNVRVSTAETSSLIENIQVQIQGVNKSMDLPAESNRLNQYVVGKSTIENALQSGDFKESSAVELSVLPIGFVPGLRDAQGKPVQIEYTSVRTNLGVSNGSGLPSYVPEETGNELVEVKGTKSAVLGLRFKGANSAAGEVSFTGVEDDPHSFSLTSGTKVCSIPKAEIVTCEVEVKPTSDGYGEVVVPIRAQLSSKSSPEVAKQVIPASVMMSRDANVSKGLRNALLLFLLFAVVQLLIRAGFASAVSQFSALAATTRHGRVKVKVFSDGSVEGANTKVFTIEEDAGFAIEVISRQKSFDLFGYSFNSSTFETFKHSTARPLGLVARDGWYSFGSAGTKTQGKRSGPPESSLGQVELTLRGQWCIAISNNSIEQLSSGSEYVDGEFVAYFDDFARTPVDTQLENFELAVSSSSFGSALVDAVERFKTSTVSDSSVPDNGPAVTQSTNDPFQTPSFDPFSDVTASVSEEPRPEKKKSKRRREGKNSDTSSSQENTATPPSDFFDPFS